MRAAHRVRGRTSSVVISGLTMNQGRHSNWSYLNNDGQGQVSFDTPDGFVLQATATCNTGSTVVTEIEGATANGDTLLVTG